MEAGLIVLAVIVIAEAVLWLKFRKPSPKQQNSVGVLNVICGNPDDQPELFLGLGVPVEDIVSQKQVLLTVNVIHENSHK